MKILESSPNRYDRGIKFLTFGKITKVYKNLASYVQRGQKVLELGCGTGNLTLELAKKGATITAIDINPEMLDIARKKLNAAHLSQQVELRQMSAIELDNVPDESYDAVVASLFFSELSESERLFVIKQAFRILKNNGLLLIADEITPKNIVKRIINALIRIPSVIITYILTQTTTKSCSGLVEMLTAHGFKIKLVKTSKLGNFSEIVAYKETQNA